LEKRISLFERSFGDFNQLRFPTPDDLWDCPLSAQDIIDVYLEFYILK